MYWILKIMIYFHRIFWVSDIYLICIITSDRLYIYTQIYVDLVGWGCRIYRLHLCKVVRLLDMRLNNLIVKLQNAGVWRMRSIPSLPSLPVSLWSGVVAPERVLSMVQIELNCILMLYWIVWNRTVYMYKLDLALNNLQWCHKIQPNQIFCVYIWVALLIHIMQISA